MGSRFSNSGFRRATQLATVLVTAGAICNVDAQEITPLPSDIFGKQTPDTNPVMDITDRAISNVGLTLEPEIPENLTINNQGGDILYNTEERTITYRSKGAPIRMLTSEGLEVICGEIVVNLQKKQLSFSGPLSIYQGESLTLAERGSYDWATSTMSAEKIKSKVTGIIIRGSKAEFKKDDEGKSCIYLQDAYASTDDSEKPDTWVGTGEMTVYPGDYGTVSRLSIATGDYDIAVPILGWFSFSHSLNPREGYLPDLGSKSSWGSYLLNSYGILIGNRRVEGNLPVSDYLLTTHLDYRTRRGFAAGLDFEDLKRSENTFSVGKWESYYVYDESPNINPTNTEREPVDHERYRIAITGQWDLPIKEATPKTTWTTSANINILSDRYMLRDYFENISEINDKPDNTVRVTRRSRLSETMLMTRFAPNDYYTTDERTELSYYRVRSSIGKTGITYETWNRLGVMRQYIPAEEMGTYRAELDSLTDPDARAYYERLLNTHTYARANSTHEFSTNFTVLNFLNITPKAGVGYSGYYGVDGVGSDNRFLGFLGVDANFKLHKHYNSFNIPTLGYKGLTHLIKPYTTLSHCNISSSNNRVPQIDVWSNEFGTTSSTPMSLDLMGFSGIDSWGTWSIWRIGISNTFNTTVDGSPHNLFKWNCFIDYNETNPNSPNKFSNLYSLVSFKPTRELTLYCNTQTPTIDNGDGFREYSYGIAWQPLAALETRLSYRTLKGHPIQDDAEQVTLQANLRINEKYSAACKWSWDIEHKRVPIQQYSLFKKTGAWYMGATLFLRDNGGKKETGFGVSFTLAETGTALPVSFF
ncbi:MAG: hypothetical protein IKZ07_04375 [Akkermansia sp.]|nr:hypothetical protein [Akkermansia sp.]